MRSISAHASAKLNLFLHVTGKREDGYHTLESLVTFCDLSDVITVKESDGFSFSCDGPFSTHIDIEDNLCISAANSLAQHLNRNPNVSLNLTKNIPIASGLGGGSADAAATLKALMSLWDVTLEFAELDKLTLSLGADLPVCFFAENCFMSGVGEIITPVQIPAFDILLVNPQRSCSTKEIFESYMGEYKKPMLQSAEISRLNNRQDVLNLLGTTDNQLYDPASQHIPEITHIIETLSNQEGVVHAAMSGSGATCFAIFDSVKQAQDAQVNFEKVYPEFWTYCGKNLA